MLVASFFCNERSSLREVQVFSPPVRAVDTPSFVLAAVPKGGGFRGETSRLREATAYSKKGAVLHGSVTHVTPVLTRLLCLRDSTWMYGLGIG